MMIKKRIALILISATLLLCGCLDNFHNTNELKTKQIPIDAEESMIEKTQPVMAVLDLQPEIEIPDLKPASPFRQYGEVSSKYQLEDALVARILYPVGPIESLNKELEAFADNAIAEYRKQALEAFDEAEPAELTLDYESFLINGEFVGVNIFGIFQHSHLAHPADVCATFNASLKTGKVLCLDDMLLEDGREKLMEIVIEKAGIDKADADGELLDEWLLTPDGLVIVLERGKYLAMSKGTKKILLPYNDISDIFVLNSDAEPEGEIEIPERVLPPFVEVDDKKPVIALTFDDGPSRYTYMLLDILGEYNAKATFFVVGNMIKGNPEALRRAVAEGHQIGSHSWSHRRLTKLSQEEVQNEICHVRDLVFEITGIAPFLFRPPYGSYNDELLETAKGLGVSFVNWSVDTLDWESKDADSIYEEIMKNVKDGSIILCHDLYDSTVEAIKLVVPELVEQGYQLVTVSQLFSIKERELEPGKLYNMG